MTVAVSTASAAAGASVSAANWTHASHVPSQPISPHSSHQVSESSLSMPVHVPRSAAGGNPADSPDRARRP